MTRPTSPALENFLEECNKAIVSGDPITAWKGRTARDIFQCWDRHLEDTRNASAADILEAGTIMLAYLQLRLFFLCVKPDRESIEKVAPAIAELFSKEFLALVREYKRWN